MRDANLTILEIYQRIGPVIDCCVYNESSLKLLILTAKSQRHLRALSQSGDEATHLCHPHDDPLT